MSKSFGNSAVANDELPVCPRCGATAEAEAFQCAECGEHLRRTTATRSSVIFVDNRRPRGSFARGISRPAQQARKSVLDGTVEDVSDQEPWPEWDDDGIEPGSQRPLLWPGDFVVLRAGFLVASAALVAAALAYGMAWLWKSAGVTFLQIAIGLGMLACCSLGMAVLAIAGKRGMASAQEYLAESEQRREAKKLQASAAPQAAELVSNTTPTYPVERDYYYQPQYVPRGNPGPATIICGVMAIIWAVITLVFSVIPVLGLFSFLPGLTTIIFLALSLTLAHYERSKRMMQGIAAGIFVLALLVTGGQYFFFGTAFKLLNESLKSETPASGSTSAGGSGQVASTNLLGTNARPATEGLFDKKPAASVSPAPSKVTPRPTGIRYTPRPTAANLPSR